jgi:hypothetical protein
MTEDISIVYINKNGCRFIIRSYKNSNLEIFEKSWSDDKEKCIFRAKSGFNIEQAKKWCEL